MNASTDYRVCRLRRHRLGGPQTRRVPAGGRLEQTRSSSVLPHRPEAIAQWAEELRQRFGGRPIAVCLELAKGPLVYALQRYPFLVLFPVNPTTLAKYREAFHVSGAKDDPSDAQLALELLITHPEKLTRLQPAERSDAHAAAAGGAASRPGRRRAPAHQSHHRRPQAVLPTGAGVVRGQGHPGVLRLPHPLAHAQARPARASGPPERRSSASTTCATPTSSSSASRPSCRPQR